MFYDSKFQFHKGTIRTHEREAKYQKFANFNSIKVRLELEGRIAKFIDNLFQFHKGTIRTKHKVQTIVTM